MHELLDFEVAEDFVTHIQNCTFQLVFIVTYLLLI